jgi:sugar lactone lactonase YvrE
VDSSGNVFVADSGNNRIRMVSHGTITTVAGNGAAGFGGDEGPATSASLNSPQGVAIDAAGNLYIADTGNNRIRKVSGGTITTVAGNAGVMGYQLADNGGSPTNVDNCGTLVTSSNGAVVGSVVANGESGNGDDRRGE